ncbi:hypothetical protein [Geoalkalibacter subterraneus]|uniref:DNA methylase N-4/N-6 domain-containing protein n=1 Tax=Geoalkalibacter subterraneus TaxID=483547 RepID=A0A0B5FVG2_9BACT|nr:hypothetical protein [Geoalkalibacter subterraneus]AJF08165.1 hypothetical protein GSUB_16825 [Geoalkalibacter subterraneus]
MHSLLSFKDRGKWGDSRWRGNCSGHVIRELVDHFCPSLFVDVCEGSGTSRDVCKELGVEYVGLDLHRGQDFTRDFVLKFLPRPADMAFSHPPYGAMIDYGSVGKWENPDQKEADLSRCDSVEQFLEFSQTMLQNQRLATRPGGHYATLIGDLRKKGEFHSFQADYIKLMPKDELVSVVIKAQHNCVSDRRSYRGSFVPIMHEYLLIWKRSEKTMLAITFDKIAELELQKEWSWRNLVRMALIAKGGKANLQELYALIERMSESKARREQNSHWQAKVRQTLQRHFSRIDRGQWALAA